MYLSYSSSTLLQIIKQRITMMHPPPQADGTCINHNVNQYHIGSGHNTGIGGHQYHIGSGHLNHNVNQYHIGSLRGRRQKGREGEGREGEGRGARKARKRRKGKGSPAPQSPSPSLLFFLPNPYPFDACYASYILEAVPWVPEDIFFLSILMVRGEAASTRREV